jgi:hypothetical protein
MCPDEIAMVKQFERVELEHSLYELTFRGVPVWERIRFDVFRSIKRQSGFGQAHSQIGKTWGDYVKGARLFFRNLFYRNPFFSQSHDFLFVGHPRRKKGDDGLWHDIYVDPVLENTNLDNVVIEPPHNLQHHTPPKTENLKYGDIIEFGSTIQGLIGINDVEIPASIRQQLAAFQRTISEEFGTEVDIVSLAKTHFEVRERQIWLYRRLLDRIDPSVVVVVVSYGKETLIEACRERSIPLVELQHGVIHESHLAYSFRGKREKILFPDYLLVWGDFWKECVEYPIPDERILPVGYPYLEQESDQYSNTPTKEQLLFVSQGTIGERLSKFAIEVNQHSEIEFDVVYKLHPGEYDRWRDLYPWLVSADFDVIDSAEIPLYRFFAQSSAQVGVGSTAIYEGLAFDLDTYIYNCPGKSTVQPLLDEGTATLVSAPEQLTTCVGTDSKKAFDREYYFKSDSSSNIYDVIDWIANGKCLPRER